MKTSKIMLAIAVAATIASCDMSNEPVRPVLSGQVAGPYYGTLRSSFSQTETPATAEITTINDYTIQVHCYSADVDTTFSLELYRDGDMMRVCFTDGDFTNQYGHDMSANHHMMGGNSNWTSWQQHMSAEHNPDDEHYGYFDMNSSTFNYTFDLIGTPDGGTQLFTGKR
ncbi:MAG: hypothetical protein RIC06_09410 [Cyclobacteriaceae bacterium]